MDSLLPFERGETAIRSFSFCMAMGIRRYDRIRASGPLMRFDFIHVKQLGANSTGMLAKIGLVRGVDLTDSTLRPSGPFLWH